MSARIINQECRAGMTEHLADNSIEAVVTDPPYGLSKQPDMAEVLRHWLAGDDYTHTGGGFMGKSWDSFVPGPSVWREALRVLKPGGYALVFAGSRTQDLMSISLRLAGFEIRDTAFWFYSTGFPKSLNLDNLKSSKTCGCMVQSDHENAEQKTEHDLRPVWGPDLSETVNDANQCGEILQQGVPQQGASAERWEQLSTTEVRTGESGMEGRGDVSQTKRELRVGKVCEGARRRETNGQEGWICDGAQADNGAMDGADPSAARSRTSRRSQSAKQSAREFGAMAGQSEPQTVGAWPLCPRCGLPSLPAGLGTALKPAYEPIIIARKPLDGTIADNVLTHGVGAINVDGCRVEAYDGHLTARKRSLVKRTQTAFGKGFEMGGNGSPIGRWPANILHDGCFDDEPWGRYFYAAKASKTDRNEGCEHLEHVTAGEVTGGRAEGSDGLKSPRAGAGRTGGARNHHPTVKPTELMRWCCRLVTPPGGTVLDPFAGSGSTGKAAVMEGFQFIGFEMDAQYAEIAKARIAHALSHSEQEGN